MDGGAGTDELFAVINGSVTPTITNIENIFLTNVSTAAAATVDFTSSTGMTSVVNRSSTFSTIIAGLSNTVPVTVRDTSLAGQTVTYNNVTGAADSATISIANLTTNATLEVAGVETLTLDSSGSSPSVMAAYNATATNATTTLNVKGAAGLTVTAALPTAITKVDGSGITGTGTTGALTVIMGSTGVATVVGGAGNDSLSVVSTTGNVSVDGGAGNDTIRAGANLTTTDTINGGDGTDDALTMTAASLAQFTAAPTTYLITNVETIGLTDPATAGATMSPAFVSATATRLNLANAATATNVTAGTATVVGGTSGDFIVGLGGSLAANTANLQGSLTLTTIGTGKTDTVTLTNSAIELTAGTNINVYNTQPIVTSGYEKLVVGTGTSSSGVAMTTGTITVGGTAGATSAETVAFTGAHRVTAGVIAADIVDASAMTFSGTAATLTMVTGSTATTVTGSAGFDILFGATGTASSITAGAGNDTINGGSANDTLLGGAGNDSIRAGGGNDSIDAGAGDDTINMEGNLASGDVINGGDGTDTILASAAILAAAASSISNVEVIGFSTTVTQNMTDFLNAGVKTLANTSGVLTVTNAQPTLTSLVLGAAGASAVTGSSLTRLSDGTADSLSVLLVDGTTGGTTLVTPSFANEETLTIGESGTDSTAAVTFNLGTVTATSLATLNITGSNNHVMTLSGATALATVNASAATGTLNVDGSASAVNMTVTGPSGTAMSIVGGSGNDSITSGSGNDSITSGAGNDTVNGGSGDDTVVGGLGTDSFVGGDGTDTLDMNYTLAGDGGVTDATGFVINIGSTAVSATTINGITTTGDLNADITSVAAGTTAMISGTPASTSTRQDFISGFENIISSAGGDYIIGSSSANTITLNAGADYVTAGAGDDTIVAAGNLTNADTIVGGAGTDTLTLTAAAATNLANVSGIDVVTLAITGAAGITTADTLVASGETLTINQSGAFVLTFDGALETNGAFVINAAGSAAHVLTGGAGADSITGGATGQTIVGGAGADTLIGGAGADTIRGGTGADIITVGGTATERIQILSGTTAGGSESGTYTATTANTVSTAAFDKYTGMAAGDTIALLTGYSGDAGVAAGLIAISVHASTLASATLTLADNSLHLIRGTYSSSTETFVGSSTGTDSLLIYDAASTVGGANQAYEAVVLIGYNGGAAGGIGGNAGVITLGAAA